MWASSFRLAEPGAFLRRPPPLLSNHIALFTNLLKSSCTSLGAQAEAPFLRKESWRVEGDNPKIPKESNRVYSVGVTSPQDENNEYKLYEIPCGERAVEQRSVDGDWRHVGT